MSERKHAWTKKSPDEKMRVRKKVQTKKYIGTKSCQTKKMRNEKNAGREPAGRRSANGKMTDQNMYDKKCPRLLLLFRGSHPYHHYQNNVSIRSINEIALYQFRHVRWSHRPMGWLYREHSYVKYGHGMQTSFRSHLPAQILISGENVKSITFMKPFKLSNKSKIALIIPKGHEKHLVKFVQFYTILIGLQNVLYQCHHWIAA